MTIKAPAIGDRVIVRTPGVQFSGMQGLDESPAIVTGVAVSPTGVPTINATAVSNGLPFQVTGIRHESDELDPKAKAWRLVAPDPVSLTATSDGTGTGQIPEGADFVIAGNGGSVNNIITLPEPVPGRKVSILASAALEIRSSAPATVAINGGAGANFESAVAAGVLAHFFCASATAWRGFQQAAAGTLTLVEVAADA